MAHERMFHHGHSHKLDDPEREQYLPSAEVVARLALRAGMNVADVGAGTGYFALPMARVLAPGGTLFAVDVQPEMLEKLRARLEPGMPVKLVEGDAAKTTLEGASVDLAFLANVFHEIDDRGAALDEMARVVRLGGRLAIVDWHPAAERLAGPPLDHRVAVAEVRAELERHGWRVSDASDVGRFHYLVIASRARAK